MRHDRLSGWQHEKVMMARCFRFSAKICCCCFQLVFRPLDVSYKARHQQFCSKNFKNSLN
jgi:hypothetical protein